MVLISTSLLQYKNKMTALKQSSRKFSVLEMTAKVVMSKGLVFDIEIKMSFFCWFMTYGPSTNFRKY